MQNEIKNIQFYQGLPSMEELNDWGVEEGHKILVLDDLMIQGVDSEQLIHMLCVGSHHSNMTLFSYSKIYFRKGNQCARLH